MLHTPGVHEAAGTFAFARDSQFIPGTSQCTCSPPRQPTSKLEKPPLYARRPDATTAPVPSVQVVPGFSQNPIVSLVEVE